MESVLGASESRKVARMMRKSRTVIAKVELSKRANRLAVEQVIGRGERQSAFGALIRRVQESQVLCLLETRSRRTSEQMHDCDGPGDTPHVLHSANAFCGSNPGTTTLKPRRAYFCKRDCGNKQHN